MSKLTLLQWNVWYKEKPENVLAFLKSVNADIVCLQEITQNHAYSSYLDVADYLTKGTGYYSYFQPAHIWETDKGKQTQGNMILSRYPLSNCRFIHIQKPAEGTGMNASHEGRILLLADVTFGDRNITIATTHMSYNDRFSETDMKLAEEKVLIESLKGINSNLIFTGDLNVSGDSELIMELSSLLLHAGPEYIEKTWTTKPFSYNGFVENELNWRLDYVFTTPDINVLESRILQTNYSDHLPVLIQVEI